MGQEKAKLWHRGPLFSLSFLPVVKSWLLLCTHTMGLPFWNSSQECSQIRWVAVGGASHKTYCIMPTAKGEDELNFYILNMFTDLSCCKWALCLGNSLSQLLNLWITHRFNAMNVAANVTSSHYRLKQDHKGLGYRELVNSLLSNLTSSDCLHVHTCRLPTCHSTACLTLTCSNHFTFEQFLSWLVPLFDLFIIETSTTLLSPL